MAGGPVGIGGSLISFINQVRFLSVATKFSNIVLNKFGGDPVENASLAQLVEQLICNQQVIGSSPIGGSKLVL